MSRTSSIARGVLKHQHVFGDRRPGQALLARRHGERACNAPSEAKSSLRVAPLQHAHRLELVAFQCTHQFRLERSAAPGRAEGAVAGGTAGTAGDLRELGRD